MRFREELRNYTEALFRLLYPCDCATCGIVLNLDKSIICDRCEALLQGARYSREKGLLDLNFSYVDDAWALYAYNDIPKRLIQNIKFSRDRRLVNAFRRDFTHWAEALHSENHYDAIIPIPITKRKLVKRQFNQAEDLGALAHRRLKIPIKRKLVKKIRHTRDQSSLSKKERTQNIAEAFRVSGENINGQSYLIVDDVLTTGSTVESAARVLKEAGAKRVDVLTIAHTEKDK